MSKKNTTLLTRNLKTILSRLFNFQKGYMKMGRIKLEKQQQQKQTHNFIAAYWVFFVFFSRMKCMPYLNDIL